MPAAAFHKRIYTPASFKLNAQDVFEHMDQLHRAARNTRLGKAFAEKIMLAVTRVNGCRYCDYGHTRAALAVGVSQAELVKLSRGELGEFPEDEAVALVFAQHYAESNGHPQPEAWRRLVDYYGADTAADILAYIRMITFGNLLGNTFDALLSRLRGKPAPDSSLANEIWVIFSALVIFPARMVAGMFRRRFKSSYNL